MIALVVILAACQATLNPTPSPIVTAPTPSPTPAPTEVAIATDATSAIALIHAYGANYPEDFAGAWIRSINGDVAVAWTKDLGQAHRAWIEAHVDRAVSLDFRDADYSLAELESLRDRIAADRAWFRTLPAEILDLDILESANKVLLEVATDVQSIRVDIQYRFDFPQYDLLVETYPRGTETIPWGEVSVRVLDRRGHVLDPDGFDPPIRPVIGGIKCNEDAAEDAFNGVPCIAGRYRVTIFYRGGVDCFVGLGSSEPFDVVPHGVTVVDVKTQLDAPATFGAESCTYPPTPR